MLNIALPKGRLGETVYRLLEKGGFPCPGVMEDGRKLIFESEETGVRYFWAKPADVPIYVERGAADIGIAGKDILEEYKPDVYELMDLGVGRCRMAVAARKGAPEVTGRTLRVATKYPGIASRYYAGLGRSIDVIRLSGSIELAPVLDLSDVIVDIVETGATLRENNLEVRETVMPVSARLIANRAGYKFKDEAVRALCAGLRGALEEREGTK
jgi:ATP phosphoribosyltransferase